MVLLEIMDPAQLPSVFDMNFFRAGAWSFSLVLVLSSAPGLAAESFHQFLPYPMPSQVFDGITSWLWLCQHLGINPGTQTNLAAVDWEHSFTFTNTTYSAPVRAVQVHFANGVCFDALGPFAISHFAADAAFVGNWSARSQAESARFYGTVEKDWRQLARSLERRLVQDVGISPTLLSQFTLWPSPYFPEMGSYGLKRLEVQWHRNGPPLVVRGSPHAPALRVEFDLGTGELKSIEFGAPELINAIARLQKNVEPAVVPNGGPATPWLVQASVEGRHR